MVAVVFAVGGIGIIIRLVDNGRKNGMAFFLFLLERHARLWLHNVSTGVEMA